MARTEIIVGMGMGTRTGQICTSPYPIEKVRNFPYSYLVNVGILRQNMDEFE